MWFLSLGTCYVITAENICPKCIASIPKGPQEKCCVVVVTEKVEVNRRAGHCLKFQGKEKLERNSISQVFSKGQSLPETFLIIILINCMAALAYSCYCLCF